MNIIRRTLAIVLCAFFISASVPAQLALGPQALSTVSAPTLKYRRSISTGAISWGVVRRVGGVSFDTVAASADNLRVNSVALDYLPDRADGERLSVIINNQRVQAPIYDWQLIPIAKFADSDLYSCFTLFGELDDANELADLRARNGYASNYHESFKDTLMGLRLFQLDNLIINPYSWDLVTNRGVYILGAGESAPNKQLNQQALRNFVRLNPDLTNGSFASYVISDRRRQAVFRIEGSTLIIQGEPSYTFVGRTTPTEAEVRQAQLDVKKEVRAKLERLSQSEWVVWLTEQVIAEAENFDRSVADNEVIEGPALRQLLSIDDRAGRRAALARESMQSLVGQLLELKMWVRVLKAWEIPALSQSISNQTAGLRAINPSVWDAGVVLLRYAAFFRYCKERNPEQWQQFMSEIRGAPTPQPRVVTPTKFVPAGSRQR
jgi:hypothetical protein